MKDKIPEKKLTTNHCVADMIAHKKTIKLSKKISKMDEIAYMKG